MASKKAAAIAVFIQIWKTSFHFEKAKLALNELK